jgi:hypothetical protein
VVVEFAIAALIIQRLKAQSVPLAGGKLWLDAGGAVAWTALTGWFCARRLRRTCHASRHVAETIVTSGLIPPLSIHWRLRGALRFRVMFL